MQVALLVAAVDVENLPAGQFVQSEYAVNFIVLDVISPKFEITSLHVLAALLGNVCDHPPLSNP